LVPYRGGAGGVHDPGCLDLEAILEYLNNVLGGTAMATKGEVLEALKKVIDPEIGLNIVDLGLVYNVDVSDERIEVEFTLTSPGCPLGNMITNDIKQVVAEATGAQQVEPKLVWDPPWSVEFMSEEAKLDLGLPI
jgi:metal-sulfur cluster biosynthetic enzyme